MSAAARIQSTRITMYAYREVRKAIRDTFKDDKRMTANAYAQARKQFLADRPNKSPGSVAEEQAVEHALAVAQILRENVVQGEGKGGTPHHYKLNIRDSTERGDNDSVKVPKSPEQERFKNTAKKFEK